MKENINKLGIFCDLSENSGLGHLNRMINLSNEFKKNKYKAYFIFNKKEKNFINKYSLNINKLFIDINLSNVHNIAKQLNNINIKIIIMDSYKLDYKFEKKLKKYYFFIVSIDDHFKKHNSNLVFTNRIKQKKTPG